jgi:hypothetical protein
MVTYRLLNDSIVRRISLILRAGEFRADGGIDLAEVVLDSGEVLNTMKGMGFITIGYAVDHVPENPLGFLSQWRPKGIFDEENKKKASRIVDLAKQAIYNEISTPCDMTSAHKALILVAGPTHELSMMGFMTVRKWIDRSIAGLETRSGDYPVVNTKNVAIIIMLTGLENIPRVGEIREIREHYRHPSSHRRLRDETTDTDTVVQSVRQRGEISDEIIVLPRNMQKTKEEGEAPVLRGNSAAGVRETPIQKKPVPRVENPDISAPPGVKPSIGAGTKPIPTEVAMPLRSVTGESGAYRGNSSPATHIRPVITQQDQIPPLQQKIPTHAPKNFKNIEHSPTERRENPTPIETGKPNVKPAESILGPGTRDTPRQRVERELERQRIMPVPEREIRSNKPPSSQQAKTPTTVVKPRVISSHPHPGTQSMDHSRHPDGEKDTEKKTVVILRKKAVPPVPEASPVPKQEKYIAADEPAPEEVMIPEERGLDTRSEEQAIEIKDPQFKAKDQIFAGKTVQKGFVPLPRDSALLKGNLHLGKKTHKIPDPESKTEDVMPDKDGSQKKTEKSIKKKDDISWI